jgi:hypothetical protein
MTTTTTMETKASSLLQSKQPKFIAGLKYKGSVEGK